MKHKLLKTMLLVVLTMTGTSVWADDNTVTVTTGSSSTGYATLKAAIEANVLSSATADMTIAISADQSLGDKVISWEKAYTLTIKATKDITIKGPNGTRWFTVKNNDAKLVVGDGVNEITLDGEYDGVSSKARSQAVALRNNTTASITFNKVTFKNFNLNNAVNMIVAEKGDGTITLQDVTISNCVNPKDGYIENQRVVNDKVLLKGYLNIDEASTGTAFYLALETKSSGTNGRIKIMDDAFRASKPLPIEYHETSTSYTPAIGASLVVKDGSLNNFTDAQVKMFTLADSEKGLVKSNRDLKLTQAYTLAVTDAGAATLVLPFASTIPEGVNCYTLTHSSGESTVNATPVSTTLSANTPVLINAAAGSHKFVSTATSGSAATGSADQSAGALTGVYSDKTFGTEITSYDNIYILNKVGSVVGFYKAAAGLKVEANHAYLTANGLTGAHGLTIVFDENEATGIADVSRKTGEGRGEYFDLSGRRVAQPAKGLYIVNGKKVVLK